MHCRTSAAERGNLVRGSLYLLGLVALVDEPGKNMAVVDREVVPLAVDVGRDHGREVATVLVLSWPANEQDTGYILSYS